MTRALAVLALVLAAASADAGTVVLYSRADADHARRAQVLARAFAPVFIDRDLKPGVPWRATIAQAICAADVVLLVWSARAAASVEVEREIETVRRCGVRVVPVLIDDTPLPADLAGVQGVDWRL